MTSPLYLPRFHNLQQLARKRIPPTPAVVMRLQRLEKPEPWSNHIRDGLAVRVQDSATNFYPDVQAFKEKLAEFLGVNHLTMVLGAGSENLVRTLMMLCCEPGTKIAYHWPTCAMYDVYSQAFGAKPSRIITTPGDKLSAITLLRLLSDDLRLLLLTNPSQPVETYFTPEEMGAIAEWCYERGCVLAIDEAYYGFGAASCEPLLAQWDNVLILRTFSKAFGGAGLRIGYALGQHRVLLPLEALRESTELSAPSMAAAEFFMDNAAVTIERNIAEVIRGRNWLRNSLTARGYKAWGQYANHVLVDVGDKAAEIVDALWSVGVRVKGHFPAPLDKHLLITCGPVHLMEAFLDRFNRVT